MRALILAAGEGRRLRPLTDEVPKPMLPVAGKPMLEHNVCLAVRHGISEIFINTHYREKSIVEHFGDGSRFGARITYSHEVELLGTSGALKPIANFLDSTFLVLYGDNVTNCDLSALIAHHVAKNAFTTIVVYHRERATSSGIVAIDSNDRIHRFLEKPSADHIFSSWINAGIYVCEPAILREIPSGFSDFGKDIFPALIEQGKALYGYRMKERLLWSDLPQDYERTQAEALE